VRTIDPYAPADKPETEQMKVIHHAMCREFALLPDLVERVPAGDTARAHRVGAHLTLMLGMLNEHHEAEDELIWPLLHQRVPLENELIDTMEAQHHAIHAAVISVTRHQQAWTRDADTVSRDLLSTRLRGLETILVEHLAREEDAVLPLVHEHLTVAEWLAPQKHAMRNGPRRVSDKLLLAGIVLDGATPAEQAWFTHEMPPPARLLWRLTGARQYAAHQRALRA
jgi:hemerythrin-like domain-containing protein